MSYILIKTVRVAGFRGLENIEVNFEKTTILCGTNNSGKSSLLNALQIALGTKQISQDDFYINNSAPVEKIVIDILLIPFDGTDGRIKNFAEDWEILFTTERIRTDINGNAFVPIRTIVSLDSISNSYKTQQSVLQEWAEFKQDEKDWFQLADGSKTNFKCDELPFFI